MLYLLNALIWTVVAVVLFTNFRDWELGNTGIAMAWLPLVFVAYNVLRWLLFRKRRRSRMRHDLDAARTPAEYHPEFDFNRPEETSK